MKRRNFLSKLLKGSLATGAVALVSTLRLKKVKARSLRVPPRLTASEIPPLRASDFNVENPPRALKSSRFSALPKREQQKLVHHATLYSRPVPKRRLTASEVPTHSISQFTWYEPLGPPPIQELRHDPPWCKITTNQYGMTQAVVLTNYGEVIYVKHPLGAWVAVGRVSPPSPVSKSAQAHAARAENKFLYGKLRG